MKPSQGLAVTKETKSKKWCVQRGRGGDSKPIPIILSLVEYFIVSGVRFSAKVGVTIGG